MSHVFYRLIAACLLCAPALGLDTPEPSARLLVHLLSYVKEDYRGAVKDGKVVNASEYGEQLEFVKHAVTTAAALDGIGGDPVVKGGLAELERLVTVKGSADAVAETAARVEGTVIRLARLEIAPRRWPDLAHGKTLYGKNCTQCHGQGGRGDGPSSGGLEPKPADFHSAKAEGTSPFQAFNAIRLGVPGTAMAAFSQLSDTEVWDLAFYVKSMRHEGKGVAAAEPAVSLAVAGSSSDEALLGILKGTDAEKAAALTGIRLHSGKDDAVALLEGARRGLAETLRLSAAGDWEAAKKTAILAYLDGVEPVEPRLRAQDPDLTLRLEGKMADVRAAVAAQAHSTEIETRVREAGATIDDAEAVLRAGGGSAAFAFTVAAGIVLREAFEALLILVTLLGVIRSLGSRRAARFVHGGWIAAVLVGLGAWVFSGWLVGISGASRELIEGAISALAVGVLLYFGFWLHRRTEIGRWRAFCAKMARTAAEGKGGLVLAGVAFMAVFREAFETVLFLRALLVESGPGSQWAMAAGLGAVFGFALVLVLGWLLLRYSVRIPVRRLFALSSGVMVFLALVLLGKAVHAFQEIGVVTATALPVPRLDLVGLYPTVETVIPQCLLLVAVAALALWGRGMARPTASAAG